MSLTAPSDTQVYFLNMLENTQVTFVITSVFRWNMRKIQLLYGIHSQITIKATAK